MTDSIDTVWLAIAVRNGLPPALLLGGAVILAIVGLALFASRSATSDGRLSMGIAITLTIFFVLGFTVSFFGGMLIWFVMLIAIGTTFGQFARPQTRRMAPPRMVQERLR
jgi:hypothetical protein